MSECHQAVASVLILRERQRSALQGLLSEETTVVLVPVCLLHTRPLLFSAHSCFPSHNKHAINIFSALLHRGDHSLGSP